MREDKLPASWVWTMLGEVAESISAGFPTGKHNNEGMGVPHLRPMNINVGGEIDLTVIRYVEDTEYQPLQQGDILFNNTNSTELVGKTAVVLEDTNWLYSNHMTRIKVPGGFVEPRYISYFLQSLFLNGVFKENSKQHVNQASIGRDFLRSLKIPLPPLADQIRIANLLDRLMEQLRSAHAALAEVPGLLRQFRQKVLAMGMRGELTREWRENHPEMSDLEFLSELKDQTTDKKKIFLREKVVDPQPFELPISWEWTHFGIVANVSANLVDPKNYPQLPLIAPDNIQKETGRLLDFQTVDEVKPISAKHKFSAGQILYSKIRPALSKVIIAEFEGICSADIYPIDSKIETGYLFSFMRSRPFLDAILSSSSRTVLPKVNQDELNLVPVPLPPLEEQKQITKQIEKFLFLADQLESDYEAAKSQLDALPQSLLSKAFRGELCTPEPGAESAEILLARIQKEKARLEIFEKQQRSQRQARKMKSEKKADLKALAAVLETSKGEWIPSRMAWQQSEHRDDIEGFYAELKRLIETEQTVEEEKRGKESFLRMTQA